MVCGDFIEGLHAMCDRDPGHGLPHRSIRSFVSATKPPQIVTIEWGATELARVDFQTGECDGRESGRQTEG
jgi:hypothetical protein